MEQGLWPPDYNISDHGSLTASFRVAPATSLSASEEVSAGSKNFEERSEEVVADGASVGAPVSAAALGDERSATTATAVEEDDDGHYGLR